MNLEKDWLASKKFNLSKIKTKKKTRGNGVSNKLV